jgi:hypothetical protein
MRDCAVFVMVKDEGYFLPKWIAYYKQFFAPQDIYILDHQSSDGSTRNLDVNVTPVVNEVAVDHAWIVNTIQDFQKKLLKEYRCVLFAESDEIVYPLYQTLGEYIQWFLESNLDYVTCIGHELMQKIGEEKPLSLSDPIMDNRDYWFRHSLYDKTLLSKVPLNWAWGFHSHQGQNVFKNALYMLHLHRHDFEMMLKRHEMRVAKWKIKDDGGASYQFKISHRDELLKYFYEQCKDPQKIPTEHKAAIRGL